MRRIYVSLALSALLLGTSGVILAQSTIESKKLPATMLKNLSTRASSDNLVNAGTTKPSAGPKNSATVGLPGVDSLANWSDQFIAPGFDSNGNPQSVWPFTMVGAPPESGRTTRFRAPIVPVTLDLLAPDGTVAIFNGKPLSFAPGPDILKAVLRSPIFQPFTFTSGTGQINDQLMRAEFFNRVHRGGDDEDSEDGWHNILVPSIKTARRMQIPFGFWFFFVDANNNPIAAAVDGNVFSTLLFPETVPVDNTTPIGAAELAGDITTRDISSFFFNNVFLFNGNINNCCVLGFHSYDFEPGDASNGNKERRFVMNFASWIDNGLFGFGFEDITPYSHELAELFNDPFVNNQTPWWLNVDPFFGFGICQNNLETGDVIEILTSNAVFPVSISGRTYHPQNEAMFPWFAFESPSPAHLGAYSFPDETTLTQLSPANLHPGCVP